MATYTKVYNNPYPDGWKDGKDGKTPVTADILNNQTETIEAIEQYLADNPIEQGGGSSGTTDYEELANKPTINGVEVVGDLSLEDLGITGGGGSGTTDYNDLDNKPSINGTELSGDITLDIPTKTSELTNDSGFLTDIKGKSYNDLADKPQINGIDLQGNLTVEELGLLDITESTDTTLENSKDGILKIKEIYGNTIQDGEPTTDAPIEIKSVVLSKIGTGGKNLCRSVTVADTTTQYAEVLYAECPLMPNTLYYISFEGTVGNKVYTNENVFATAAPCIIKSGRNVIGVRTRSDLPEMPEGGYLIFKNSIEQPSANTFKNVMISLDVDTNYTPCQGYSVVTLSKPITLNGIGGVQDYVDVKNNVEHHKFAYERVLGSNITSINTSEAYAIYGNYIGTNIVGKSRGLSLSNRFIGISYDDRANNVDTFRCYLDDNKTLTFRTSVSENANFSDLETVKAYFDNNEIYALYELAEPIETPLPEADVEALKSLKTYDGVTHIFTDSPVAPDWLVEYNTTRVGTELDKINKRITDIGTTAQINYSTEEQVVGTWIDGKPLYQKTFSYGTLPNASILDIEHNIENIEEIWIISGWCKNLESGNTLQLNTPNPNGNENSFYFSVNSTKIRCETGTDRTNYFAYVTIQYTKTTDTV